MTGLCRGMETILNVQLRMVSVFLCLFYCLREERVSVMKRVLESRGGVMEGWEVCSINGVCS